MINMSSNVGHLATNACKLWNEQQEHVNNTVVLNVLFLCWILHLFQPDSTHNDQSSIANDASWLYSICFTLLSLWEDWKCHWNGIF